MAVKLINGDESSEAASRFIPPGLPAWSGRESKYSYYLLSLVDHAFWKANNKVHLPICTTLETELVLLCVIELQPICVDITYIIYSVCIVIRAKNLCVYSCAYSCRPCVCTKPVKQQFPYPSNSQRSEAFRQPAVGWWRLAEHASDSIWASFSFKASHLPVS